MSSGVRRQLPPWMLSATTSGQTINSVSQVKNKENSLEKLPTGPCEPESSVVNDASTCDVESTKTELCSLKKCKTTRSRRKLAKRVEDDVSTNMHQGDLDKENYAPPKRKRKTTRSNAVKSSTVSEDELTVDDLIRIAKECINAEKEKEGYNSSLGESESESLSISNVNALEASSTNLAEGEPSDKVSSSSSLIASDPAQDMLEILLGPMLKRSQEVQPKHEPVMKSVTMNLLSINPSQYEDGDPLATNKGSLKDMVDMLLS